MHPHTEMRWRIWKRKYKESAAGLEKTANDDGWVRKIALTREKKLREKTQVKRYRFKASINGRFLNPEKGHGLEKRHITDNHSRQNGTHICRMASLVYSYENHVLGSVRGFTPHNSGEKVSKLTLLTQFRAKIDNIDIYRLNELHIIGGD